MDRPSKDCQFGDPGYGMCSVDDYKQYLAFYRNHKMPLNVHFSSGIYNRAFYLLSTSPGWDVRKAFEVMLHANAYYWLSNTNFTKGVCSGVIPAAKDLGYDTTAIIKAFTRVGVINATSCRNA